MRPCWTQWTPALKGEFDLNSAWVPAPDVDQLNAQLDELLAALDAAEA